MNVSADHGRGTRISIVWCMGRASYRARDNNKKIAAGTFRLRRRPTGRPAKPSVGDGRSETHTHRARQFQKTHNNRTGQRPARVSRLRPFPTQNPSRRRLVETRPTPFWAVTGGVANADETRRYTSESGTSSQVLGTLEPTARKKAKAVLVQRPKVSIHKHSDKARLGQHRLFHSHRALPIGRRRLAKQTCQSHDRCTMRSDVFYSRLHPNSDCPRHPDLDRFIRSTCSTAPNPTDCAVKLPTSPVVMSRHVGDSLCHKGQHNNIRRKRAN